MASFNKVIIMGNLTRTPELRSTPGGSQVTDITLAINDVFTDSSGNKQERVTFVDVTFWGKQAETLCRWKKQGDPLLVEGRLQTDKWQDKQTGQNRTKLKVIGNSFTFLPRGQGGGEGGGGGGGSNRGGNRGNYNRGGQGGQGGQGNQAQEPQGGGEYEGGYEDYATSLPENSEGEPPF
ncbi:MAG: single-stranded DNA-binding protein [Planctomycetes bacterium]|nr:single-stranded DNA-binding protein [Planctomycetota bacterium]MCW8136286.1 single-stranded DNA-binding protein [Planctomycetota bacterium]